jgi:hypothetical protein
MYPYSMTMKRSKTSLSLVGMAPAPQLRRRVLSNGMLSDMVQLDSALHVPYHVSAACLTSSNADLGLAMASPSLQVDDDVRELGLCLATPSESADLEADGKCRSNADLNRLGELLRRVRVSRRNKMA